MSQFRSVAKQFLLRAAIGAGTTIGLFGLVSTSVYLWSVARPGSANAGPFFTALFVPTALKLLLGAIVVSIVLAALSYRDTHRTAVAVLVTLFVVPVISCWLVLLTLLWSEWTPAPSPQPYPGVEGRYRLERLVSRGRCASYTYEVALPPPLLQDHYEEQMDRYCSGSWGFGTTPPSKGACHEATCDILRSESLQYFAVQICPLDSASSSVIHKDCVDD